MYFLEKQSAEISTIQSVTKRGRSTARYVSVPAGSVSKVHAQLNTQAGTTEKRFESLEAGLRNAQAGISYITGRMSNMEAMTHGNKRRRVDVDPSNHRSVEQQEGEDVASKG